MTDVAINNLVHVPDYFAILRRRKWPMLAAAFLIMMIAVAATMLWPTTYRSSATILIEDSGMPADFVKSTMPAFAKERLQAIQERVITTQNLIGIIDKFNLYADARRYRPMNLIVDHMRGKINLDVVSANATDPKNGLPGQAAITFTLSFDGKTPQAAQRVTNELTALYLAETQRAHDEQTAGTAGFLRGESQRLQTTMLNLQDALSKFMIRNEGSLPEDLPTNAQLMDRAQSQLLEIAHQIQPLREHQQALQAQLIQTDPYIPTKAIGGVADRTDINALKFQIQKLTANLQAASKKYGAKHPEIIRLNRELKAAQTQLATSARRTSKATDNPAYLQLQSEIAGVTSEISAMENQQRAVEEASAEIEKRLQRAPEIERSYLALKRDYDNAVARYVDVISKRIKAQSANNAAFDPAEEKLSLIESPLEPMGPMKPDSRMILTLGFFLAIVGGITVVVLSEIMDGRIHGSQQLATILGQRPLAVVPVIRTTGESFRSVLSAMSIVFLCCLICALILTYLHLYVAPLDVLWAALRHRFGIF